MATRNRNFAGIVIVLFSVVVIGHCYSWGSPLNDEGCDTMSTFHWETYNKTHVLQHLPQVLPKNESEWPYTLNVSSLFYENETMSRMKGRKSNAIRGKGDIVYKYTNETSTKMYTPF